MQTKLGVYATNKINEDFDTNLSIGKVNLSFLGSIALKEVQIRDHHKDTLIFLKKISTSLLSVKKIFENKLLFDAISIEDAFYFMKTYQGETTNNMDVFSASFHSDTPKDSLDLPFILNAKNIYIQNLDLRISNENKEKPLIFSATNIGGNVQDLAIVGADVALNTRGLYFRTNQDLQVTNLTTNYKFTNSAMAFENTRLETENSRLSATIFFTYGIGDLSNFNDKVQIEAEFKESKLKVLDLKKIYSELNGGDMISFSGKMKGKLNNFNLNNLKLTTEKGIRLDGDLGFKNAINKERGFVFNGDLNTLIANYKELKNIAPNLLGKNLPSELEKFGQFSVNGKVNITSSKVKAILTMKSQIGAVVSDLEINNIDKIDAASYSGDIQLIKFNIGSFLKNPVFGNVSLKGAVNGSGFKLNNLNTNFVGAVSELNFNNYSYHNIIANGQYQNNKFDGSLVIDDANFKMKFNGLADLSSEVHKFDFKSEISYLNLKETNLFKRDTVSVVKGIVQLDIEGNTFDDIVGVAIFKNVFYTNQIEEYGFNEFTVTSSLKEDIKIIEVASNDILNGFIRGDFSFSELPKVAQNALGSIYTNYKPYKVAGNQYLDFNFTVYNQIVNVFFPKVFIDDETKIKGKINADEDLFRLSFNSPKIDAYGTEVKAISLRTDNKNTLYNTSLTADEVNTAHYNISKLNLLNRTENDTLYFKSIFKGGNKKNEDFNLDFY
ncbi:translocation/assembly module TamB, partial [Polaribacter sp.]|nr:translocation/assembly module TamB [Polaribacter sp.]